MKLILKLVSLRKQPHFTEKINVLADYKQFYNLAEVDTKVIYAIVIMTDSDNTQTLSAADYDDIYFSKN